MLQEIIHTYRSPTVEGLVHFFNDTVYPVHFLCIHSSGCDFFGYTWGVLGLKVKKLLAADDFCCRKYSNISLGLEYAYGKFPS